MTVPFDRRGKGAGRTLTKPQFDVHVIPQRASLGWHGPTWFCVLLVDLNMEGELCS